MGANTGGDSPILSVEPLGFPWQTADPFLFCVHHLDNYPRGNGNFGPAEALTGRQLGQDFSNRDGWSMYHGRTVPGFPQHPHRGFETITIARQGLIDHADSLGAKARFGKGDVQWMTAGKGIVHAEMFPLLNEDRDNPTELFQIWLNLPAKSKMVAPHFTMLWADTIPEVAMTDDAGRLTRIRIVAGQLDGQSAPQPPPSSWASQPKSDLAIYTMQLEPNARCALPAALEGTNRTLYFFAGESVSVNGETVPVQRAVGVRPNAALMIENGPTAAEVLVLQGRPIGEPVAHHGPFVMNTQAELRDTIDDYQRTRFGGWPWDSHAPVHGANPRRFAIHADGRREDQGT